MQGKIEPQPERPYENSQNSMTSLNIFASSTFVMGKRVEFKGKAG
jgi:hypothetical protein